MRFKFHLIHTRDSIHSGLTQPAKQKLAEPQHLFDDAKDRFHGGFALGVNRLPSLVSSRYRMICIGVGSCGGSGSSLKRSI